MLISGANRLLMVMLCVSLAGCGTADPIAYAGIDSSARLSANPHNDTGRIPFSYAEPVDWPRYSRIIIDPVVVYKGADHQFGDLTEKDRELLASYMQVQFTNSLEKKFALTQSPAPNTLRLRLTLTGATASTPVLSTLSRFDMAGGVYNGVQNVSGGEGTFTGAVIYTVEIYDSRSKRLLSAFIAKQYPNPYDIPASMGALDAAKSGIDKGANELIAQLK
jgi:uncharacterized lipoprotein YmbA